MENASLFTIVISAILVNNFVLSRFLGICPFLGVSKKVDTALGMGLAVTFVMTMAGIFTYLINELILVPFNIEYMQTIAFILVIAYIVTFLSFISPLGPSSKIKSGKSKSINTFAL